MPSVFIGHGSPMNTIENNSFTEAWQALAQEFPLPKAILAISAHWYVRATSVTAMERPRTIHDFSGFPDELFSVQYNAPGSPQLASRVKELLAPTHVILDEHEWGLDHGTWSVLAHLYPKANVPVVQLSIDATLPIDQHMSLGRKLAPLANEGVLILGSGNVVHNLSRIQWGAGNTGTDWANRFDTDVAEIMSSEPTQLAGITTHSDWALSAPTPEHFLPLAYIAGIASETRAEITRFNYSRTMGSLSMTSYVTRPATL